MIKKILLIILVTIATACTVMIVTKPKGDVSNGGAKPSIEYEPDFELGIKKKDTIN